MPSTHAGYMLIINKATSISMSTVHYIMVHAMVEIICNSCPFLLLETVLEPSLLLSSGSE